MNQRKMHNQFKPVKINAKNFNAPGTTDATDRLAQLYVVLEAKKVEAVAAARKVAQFTQDAAIKQAEAISAELALITAASEYDKRIAGERLWLVYQEPDTYELIFEGWTERLIRNNMRAQQAQIGKSMDSDGSSQLDDMFEDEEDDDNNNEA
jgi:hypothetical protein